MLDDVLQCFVYKQYNSDQLVMQVHEKNFPTVIVNLYRRLLGVNDVSDMFIYLKKKCKRYVHRINTWYHPGPHLGSLFLWFVILNFQISTSVFDLQ